MAQIEEMTPGEVLADAKVAQFIKELGIGIAEAQTELDENSVRQMEAFTRPRDGLGGRSLLQLGLMPPFYHYEHADLSVSLQLRLQVAETDEFGFGLDARFDSDRRSSEESEASDRLEESGSRVEMRSARLTYRADSEGALVVNGTTIEPAGSDPFARIRDLREKLLEGDAVDALFADRPDRSLDISTDAPSDRVVVTDRSVAFQKTLRHRGLIVIRETEETEYVLNADTSVEPAVEGDLAAYAEQVTEAIDAEAGFEATHLPPLDEGEPSFAYFFANDNDEDAWAEPLPDEPGEGPLPDQEPEEVMKESLVPLARILAQTGERVVVEGMTDRAGSPEYNVGLGNRRAERLREILIDNGVDPEQIEVEPSGGEDRADEAEVDENERSGEFRAAWISTPDRTDHWIRVAGAGDPPSILADVSPDLRADPGEGNGFVHLWSPGSLDLSSHQVTIEGDEFGFSGSAGGGYPSGSAEAHAYNLTNQINETDDLRASQRANVVHVMRASDEYDIQLYSRSSEEISISGSEGLRVEREFSRVRTSRVESQEGRRTTIGVGATLDMRETRQFGLTVTGNSSISARLVSVPAPDEFKAAIRAMQEERER